MAFRGRINSQGTMVSRELFCGRVAEIQPHQVQDNEALEGSRTYIKTYDSESLLRAMASPSTVRYGGGSGSSSEVNSLDETECSTLRRCSLASHRTLVVEEDEEYEDAHELDTGSETLCLRLGSTGSTSSSSSSSNPSSRSSSSRESAANDKSSTTSMCSWEEAMSRGGKAPSYSLPTLHLGSDRVSAPLTFTRRLDPLRLERPAGEAYENWLAGKRQQAQYQRQAEQRKREEQVQRAEVRQQLSQERYEQWCRQKAQQSSTPTSRQAPSSRIPPRKSPAAAAINTSSRMQQWELEKLRLAEQQRLQLRNVERRRQQEKLQRQQQAEHAFQRWMSHVDQRPKPVPSSQGIQSLRGTISDLYINPNRWVD